MKKLIFKQTSDTLIYDFVCEFDETKTNFEIKYENKIIKKSLTCKKAKTFYELISQINLESWDPIYEIPSETKYAIGILDVCYIDDSIHFSHLEEPATPEKYEIFIEAIRLCDEDYGKDAIL